MHIRENMIPFTPTFLCWNDVLWRWELDLMRPKARGIEMGE